MSNLDERCPEVIRCRLRHIAEQCGKRQYFNALCAASELVFLLTQGAVDAVNGRNPTPTFNFNRRDEAVHQVEP